MSLHSGETVAVYNRCDFMTTSGMQIFAATLTAHVMASYHDDLGEPVPGQHYSLAHDG